VDALAEMIVTMGRIMSGNPSIREVDLNPVIVYPKGEGVIALDALMLVD
jgi:succinyl-CoA synthetase beta subunit